MLPEQIKTINNFHQKTLKERGSEFIAIVYPIDNEADALNHLNEIRKKYFDATHHCYTYKIKSGEQKYSDDGEPNGSAGIRILNAIEHFDLTDLILIVVRYFGGIKLGVGPLGKAYYTSAINVLEESEIVTETLYEEIDLELEFNYISHIHRIINQFSAIISKSQFTTKAFFKCYVRPTDYEKLQRELTNLTHGQISIKRNLLYKYFIKKIQGTLD